MDWALPLLGAIFAGGGVAGVVTALSQRRKSSAEADKVRVETEALTDELDYIHGEKLITLAERAAEIVATKYEAIINRQDIVITRQQEEIETMRAELEDMKKELQLAQSWQDDLVWYETRVQQLTDELLKTQIAVPEPWDEKPVRDH